jgi:hypothetical protein
VACFSRSPWQAGQGGDLIRAAKFFDERIDFESLAAILALNHHRRAVQF